MTTSRTMKSAVRRSPLRRKRSVSTRPSPLINGRVGTGFDRELTHRRPDERHSRTRPAGPPRSATLGAVAQVNRGSGLKALPSGRARPGRRCRGIGGRASLGGAVSVVPGPGAAGGGGAGADGAETGMVSGGRLAASAFLQPALMASAIAECRDCAAWPSEYASRTASRTSAAVPARGIPAGLAAGLAAGGGGGGGGGGD